MERHGPKWLDWIGADRFRRHIISAHVSSGVEAESEGNEKLEKILPVLGQLPRLRYLELWIEDNHLPPGMADALAKTPQLRALSISLNLTPNNDNDSFWMILPPTNKTSVSPCSRTCRRYLVLKASPWRIQRSGTATSAILRPCRV